MTILPRQGEVAPKATEGAVGGSSQAATPFERSSDDPARNVVLIPKHITRGIAQHLYAPRHQPGVAPCIASGTIATSASPP